LCLTVKLSFIRNVLNGGSDFRKLILPTVPRVVQPEMKKRTIQHKNHALLLFIITLLPFNLPAEPHDFAVDVDLAGIHLEAFVVFVVADDRQLSLGIERLDPFDHDFVKNFKR